MFTWTTLHWFPILLACIWSLSNYSIFKWHHFDRICDSSVLNYRKNIQRTEFYRLIEFIFTLNM